MPSGCAYMNALNIPETEMNYMNIRNPDFLPDVNKWSPISLVGCKDSSKDHQPSV